MPLHQPRDEIGHSLRVRSLLLKSSNPQGSHRTNPIETTHLVSSHMMVDIASDQMLLRSHILYARKSVFPNVGTIVTPQLTDERFEYRGEPPRIPQNLKRGSDFLSGCIPEPGKKSKVKSSCGRRRGLIGGYRTVHFRARIVDVDGVQILPSELPRLNTAKHAFQHPTVSKRESRYKLYRDNAPRTFVKFINPAIPGWFPFSRVNASCHFARIWFLPVSLVIFIEEGRGRNGSEGTRRGWKEARRMQSSSHGLGRRKITKHRRYQDREDKTVRDTNRPVDKQQYKSRE